MAIFGVLCLHVFQTWPNAEVLNFKIISLSAIFKFCVPIFLMLSGALLLNKDISLPVFFKKRFARLTYPFILYMVIYVIALYLIMVFFSGFGDLYGFIDNVPFKYNWYFWTIASLYFSVPVINKFIQHSTIKEIEYFLYVFIFGSIFYQITLYFGIIHYINLNLFVSPLGYLILGYYLSIKEFTISPKKLVSLALLIFVISTLFKMGMFLGYFPKYLIENSEAARSLIVYSWIDLGFMELLQSSAVFIFFRYLFESDYGVYSKIRNFLEINLINRVNISISKASYGMYLIHHTFLEPLRIVLSWFALTGFQTFTLIWILSILLFCTCWVMVYLISKIPIIGQFSGYH